MAPETIMSISEMIHLSFGESKDNMVNFKLVQAVLYLLARQLRVLERLVEVKVGIFEPNPTATSSNLSVTEVKINATVPKKKRKTSQELTQKTTANDSALTKPRPSGTDDIISFAYKTSTQTSASLIQSHNEDKRSRHDHLHFLPTSEKGKTYKQSETSNDQRFTVSVRSDKFSKEEQKTSEHTQAKGQTRTVVHKRKVSLRDDPTSKPYFTKIKQSFSKEHLFNKVENAITSTKANIISEQHDNSEESQATRIDLFSTIRISPRNDPMSNPYFAKVHLKSLEEPENLSVHDVLQQFHSFKASLTSLNKPLTHEKLSNLQKSSLPSLSNVVSGVKILEKTYLYDNVNEIATTTDQSETKSILLDDDKKTEEQIKITNLKLPFMKPTPTLFIPEKYEDNKVQRNLINLFENPISMPYFAKTSLAVVIETKKANVRSDQPPKGTLLMKSKDKLTKARSGSSSQSMSEKQAKVTLDENHQTSPEPTSFLEDKPTNKSYNVQQRAEEKKTPETTQKLQIKENMKSIPYFTKLQPIEVSQNKTKREKNINSKLSKTTSTTTQSSIKYHKEKSYKKAEVIKDKLPHEEKSEVKLVPSLKNLMKDGQDKHSAIACTESRLLYEKKNAKDESTSYYGSSSKTKIDSKCTSTSNSSLNSEITSKKPSLYEEALDAAKKLSLQQNLQIQITSKNSSRSKDEDPKNKIFFQQDVRIHTSLTSLKSPLQTSSLESVVSSKDDSSKSSAKLPDVSSFEDKSDEINQQSVHEDFMEQEEEGTDFKESPLHSDQSFVVRPAGPWGTPLPKDPGMQPKQINQWEHKTTRRRVIKSKTRQSTYYKKQLESQAGSVESMKKNEFNEAESLSYEYENYESFEEVKGDDGSSDTITVPSKKGFFQTWSNDEMQREKELRVINQRADSHEEPDLEPIPMALVESTEIKHEKLFIKPSETCVGDEGEVRLASLRRHGYAGPLTSRLIVERTPSIAGTSKRGVRLQEPTPKLSIVTKEEFKKLEADFNEFRNQYTGTHELPENSELINQLRRGASLTDAMSALKLSARLEAAEKAIKFLSGVVTEICKEKYIDVEPQINIVTQNEKKVEKTSKMLDSTKIQQKAKKSPVDESLEENSHGVDLVNKGVSVIFGPRRKSPFSLEDDEYVTYEELNEAMRILEKQLMKAVRLLLKHSDETRNEALKTSLKLEKQLEEALNLGNRMNELYEMVSKYSSRITDIDTGISAQMTSYQDQLTQMQFDLESTIVSVSEAIASSGADPELIIELRKKITSIEQNLDSAITYQKDLHNVVHSISLDIEDLWKEIEILRATKCDHEELHDALHDKVETSVVNGMIEKEQFEACMDEIRKKIRTISSKFNAQEIQWQKAIDEFVEETNKKADFTQLTDLRDNLHKHVEYLQDKIKSLSAIVGEPKASAISKHIIRDSNCLSCRLPALLNPEGTGVPNLPALTRPPTIGAEAMTEGGDGMCRPGQTVQQHTLCQRTILCRRYCGGYVTGQRQTLNKISIKPMTGSDQSIQVGSDGKCYIVGGTPKKPCYPCNYTPEQPEEALAQEERPVASKFQLKENESLSSDDWSLELPIGMRQNSASNPTALYDDDDNLTF